LMRLRKKRVSETSLEGSVERDEFDQPQREFGAPDLTLTGSIDRMQIERAVARLARGYRQIFVLHDVQGYKHHEIAALLGVSVGNSKSQLHKARIKLRTLLRETGPENRKELRLAHA
jgi:RNA polymerase sigma-70 factor, ECF subfamily